MLSRAFAVPALLILGLALPACPASADPIRITGGSVTLVGLQHTGDVVDIHGTQGFRGEFNLGNPGGPLCGPCGAPGDRISLDAYVSTVDGGGTVEFAGVQYPVGSDNLFTDAFVSLQPRGGPVTLPPSSPHASLSVPFELGADSVLMYSGDLGVAVVPLVGSGTATLNVIASPFGDQLWELSSVRYDFATTPEPATVLLVGTGMFVLAPRRYRRRRRDLRNTPLIDAGVR